MADTTPMSRTRPARSPNERDSSAGRPNSLTSSAPDTLNRSVIVAFIEAFSPYDSRVIACSRWPIRRAGTTKTGSRISESTVICQDSENITPAVRTSAITLETTPDSVEVNACWAPITSLLSRLISAPVWVRVKNASGIRCTWSNTRVRRSRMSPSPMRAEYHRWARDRPASKTARIATRTAIFTTVAGSPCELITLTTRPASTGVITPITALAVTVTRKTVRSKRYGRAKPAIRPRVPLDSFWSVTDVSRRYERITIHGPCPPGIVIAGTSRRHQACRTRRASAAQLTAKALPAQVRGEGAQAPELGGALGGLLLVTAAAGRAEQQRLGLGGDLGRRRQQRGDQVGDGTVQCG